MTTHKEIKTCPFCGSSATFWEVIRECWVSCNNDACGCQTGFTDTKDEAVKIWNRRMDGPQLDDEIDAILNMTDEEVLKQAASGDCPFLPGDNGTFAGAQLPGQPGKE